MRSVSVAEAKAHLSEIIQAAEAGEDIRITRHGQPVARLVAEKPVHDRPVDMERLRRIRAKSPRLSTSAVQIVRQDRDAD
jgi:prevent-host-death family protein